MSKRFPPILKAFFITVLFFIVAFSAIAQQEGPPPNFKESVPGLGIYRSVLMKTVFKKYPDMVFNQGSPINNLPNYIATDGYDNAIQLIGKNDEIIIAKWTYTFGDTSKMVEALSRMAYFTYTFCEQTGVNWLTKNVQAISHNQSRAFTEEERFDYNRKGELKFDPMKKTLTLTFIPYY